MNREQRRMMEQLRGKLGGVNPFYSGRPAAGSTLDEMMGDRPKMPDLGGLEPDLYPIVEWVAAHDWAERRGKTEIAETIAAYLDGRVEKMHRKLKEPAKSD